MEPSPGTLAETLEQWVVTLICDTYPDMTLPTRRAIYRGSPALKQGYALMKAAQAVGDTTALQRAARQTYLAWVTALKAASEASTERKEPLSPKGGSQGAPDQIVAPAPQESPFRRYHSADLGEDILLCPDVKSAQPYWDNPDTIVAYTPGELQVLRQVVAAHPTDFRVRVAWLHAQKRLFGGSLERLPPEAIPQEKP